MKPEAKAAGLNKGDRIDGLNGGGYTGLAQWSEILSDGHPGDTLDVEFARSDGSPKTGTITMDHGPYFYGSTSAVMAFWQEFLVAALLPLICLGMGYWVVLARPLDRNAWLLLVLLTFPCTLSVNSGLATGVALFLRSLWNSIIQLAVSPALLLFGIYFPERSRIDARARWLKWIILGPLAACIVILLVATFADYYKGGDGPLLTVVSNDVARVLNFLNLLCVIFYLVLTVDKLRSASTEDARRRLRVLAAGTGVGVGAF